MQTTLSTASAGDGLPPKLLTALEAKAFLNISPRKLWSETKSGKVRCIRIGRAVRYSIVDLEAYIASRRDATP